MNEENTEYLYNNFTSLYMDLYCPSPKYSNMFFGVEVGDGWFELIKELSAKLNPLGVVASQVKEKYGTLRFYVYHGTDEAFDLIDEAEDKSATICELCGEPGKLYSEGWCVTRCKECYDGDTQG